MRDYTTWMQSRFYTPAFNSAIFDGPIRIYFAQLHEPLALKIYFGLQQRFENEVLNAKRLHRQTGNSVCILLYPNSESFELSFQGLDAFMTKDQLGNDQVLAIRGPFEDQDLDEVLKSIAEILRTWNSEVHGSNFEVAAQASV